MGAFEGAAAVSPIVPEDGAMELALESPIVAYPETGAELYAGTGAELYEGGTPFVDIVDSLLAAEVGALKDWSFIAGAWLSIIEVSGTAVSPIVAGAGAMASVLVTPIVEYPGIGTESCRGAGTGMFEGGAIDCSDMICGEGGAIDCSDMTCGEGGTIDCSDMTCGEGGAIDCSGMICGKGGAIGCSGMICEEGGAIDCSDMICEEGGAIDCSAIGALAVSPIVEGAKPAMESPFPDPDEVLLSDNMASSVGTSAVRIIPGGAIG